MSNEVQGDPSSSAEVAGISFYKRPAPPINYEVEFSVVLGV